MYGSSTSSVGAIASPFCRLPKHAFWVHTSACSFTDIFYFTQNVIGSLKIWHWQQKQAYLIIGNDSCLTILSLRPWWPHSCTALVKHWPACGQFILCITERTYHVNGRFVHRYLYVPVWLASGALRKDPAKLVIPGGDLGHRVVTPLSLQQSSRQQPSKRLIKRHLLCFYLGAGRLYMEGT